MIDPGANAPVALARAIREKVRRDLGLAGGFDDQSRFVHAIRQRLVHQHVLALLHGGDRDGGVEMIGRHDRSFRRENHNFSAGCRAK